MPAACFGSPLHHRVPCALLSLVVTLSACAWGAPARAQSCLQLDTELGTISIELQPTAAPGAVALIEKLALGPIYELDLVPRPDAARDRGYFDGLSFDFAKPKLEIRLPARVPAAAFVIPTELDAVALGLDRERVADAGEAMNRLQFDLLPARKRPSAERRSTPRLEEWARRFETDYDPSFLVGTSIQEIREAIGYEYRDGLESLPATRGAVALVPVSPTEAELTLTILLADHPRRTGRWMVIGRVASGLEIADRIAMRPLAQVERRDYRPLHPVQVDRGRLSANCSNELKGGTP